MCPMVARYNYVTQYKKESLHKCNCQIPNPASEGSAGNWRRKLKQRGLVGCFQRFPKRVALWIA